jgi:hypothetical protein
MSTCCNLFRVLSLVGAGTFAAGTAGGQTVFTSQQPVSGGGVARWSQLWQDPGPNGNDLDGDSVCWEDFTLGVPSQINHIEWWGKGACEQGFLIEFWKQDPGTIAYQPLGVFYYGGNHAIQPEAKFRTTAYTVSPGPGGINHYVLDLASPVSLPANTAANPRWFIDIVGLTGLAYYTWDWSQGLGGSTRSFQFIRGGTSGGGPLFRQLPEGRAMVLSGSVLPGPCYPDCNGDGLLNLADFGCFQTKFALQDPYADCNGDGFLGLADFGCFQTKFALGCP